MIVKNLALKLVVAVCLSNSLEFAMMREMRIGFLTSWHKKWGISTYVEHLKNALEEKGLTVFAYEYDTPTSLLIDQLKEDHITVLNIQYDSIIFPDGDKFNRSVEEIKRQTGIKIFVTIHFETRSLNALSEVVDGFLCFKQPALLRDMRKARIITMGIPLFETPTDRGMVRDKYHFSKDDLIISTFGFMLPWKNQADVLASLIPILKRDSRVKIQLLTSFSDVYRDACMVEFQKIKDIIALNHVEGRVIHIIDFLPQQELSERLWMSDVGYLWGGPNLPASSGAIRDFMAARLPFVITTCKHYENVTSGGIRVAADFTAFKNAIEDLLFDGSRRCLFQKELDNLYRQSNCGVSADELVDNLSRAVR